MRKNVALFTVWALAVGGFIVVSQSGSSGAPLPAFSGYSTGSNIHADVLRVSDVQQILNADVASSAAAVDSDGFDPAGIHNEENFAVVPTAGAPDALVDSGGKESYGRGSGLEIGVATGLPNNDENQIIPGGIAEAGAQPAERSDGDPPAGPTDTGLVESELAEITQADPLLYAQLLEGQARARFDETQCLTTGNLSEGRGQTAKAQLVDTSSDPATGDLDAPLVNASSDFFGSGGRGVSQTWSMSYLVDNLDGTWGLATETHMTFAPVGLLQSDPTAPPPVFVEILGEWIFRAVATGKAGGANVTYEVAGLSDDPDPTVIRVYLGAPDNATTPTIPIRRSDLFGDEGIDIAIPPGPLGPKLISLTLGEDIRAISAPNVLPDPLSDPTETGNGTLASGAADVVRISAVNADAGVPNGPEVANVRIGHLEAEAQVPAGGIVCPAPPAATTTTGGATTTTEAGATTTTTAAGATTTTTADGATTTTTAADATTTTTAAGATTTTIPTSVAGVQISRSPSPAAQAVTAQPRFTG
ncbi:MAG: hypothetical protein QOG87_154 [Actinomycetota bacterium]